MRPVRYLPQARRELQDSVDYYEEKIPNLGREFLREVDEKIELVRSSPDLGSPLEGDARRVLLKRFPIALIYFLDQGEVVVAAVAHQRRRPGYWRDRTK